VFRALDVRGSTGIIAPAKQHRLSLCVTVSGCVLDQQVSNLFQINRGLFCDEALTETKCLCNIDR
jgi:hypothetical protein